MIPTTDDFRAIAALDLEAIKAKLMHVKGGKGWSAERVAAVEREYRRFLYLMKKFPNEATAPLVDVDTFWHYHILDTMKYAADCEQVFGYFLHHFPYVGMRGKGDEGALERMGERMRAIYEDTFGEDYLGGLAAAPAARTARSAGVSGAGAHGGQARTAQGQAAYCSVTLSRPAYCSVALAEAAYCSVPQAAPSYCSVALAETAYCSVTLAEPAYCSVTLAKPAYCSAPSAEAAYCSAPSAKPAYCSAPSAEPAYCSVTAARPASVDAGDGRPCEYRAGFYLERPRLQAA